MKMKPQGLTSQNCATLNALRKIASSFRRGLLGRQSSKDCCFVVSWPLCGLLNSTGVACDLSEGYVNGNAHWWITLRDGRIIDATADQFRINKKRLPRVYVGSLPPFYTLKDAQGSVVHAGQTNVETPSTQNAE